MKRRADGYLIPENAQSRRPADESLSSAEACRLREEKVDFFCLDSRATKSLSHSNPVIAVTDTYSSALLMCFYSASSSEARQALLLEKLELIRVGPSFPVTQTQVRVRMAAPKKAASNRLHRGQNDKHVRAVSRAVDTTPKFTELNLPENGNQRVSGLSASGSKRI